MNATSSHQFTRLELKQAEHEFAEAIKKHFGEIWQIKSDGEYRGVAWECRSMVSLDAGIWRLCQEARHKGATRAAGKIEVRDTWHCMRLIIFYNSLTHPSVIYEH